MRIRRRLELALAGAAVRRGQPRKLLLGEIEGRVLHSQRTEQPLLEELVERLARDDLDDPCRGVDSRLAVDPLRARLERERLGDIERDEAGQVRDRAGLVGRDLAHAGSVREQVADREPRRLAVRGLQVLEFRQVLLDRIVDGELALVLEHEHGRAGDRLGHRGDPEDRVRSASACRAAMSALPIASRWTIRSGVATSVTRAGDLVVVDRTGAAAR